MSWPTESQVRAQLKAMAETALPGAQILDFLPMDFKSGDDMTALRSDGVVDTLIITAAGVGQSNPPHDAARGITTPRGKNVVERKYRTWLFNESESALMVRLEAWREKVNQTPKLGFSSQTAEFIESVSRLQVPVIDSFATGDPTTPIACFAQAELTVRVVEPQERR